MPAVGSKLKVPFIVGTKEHSHKHPFAERFIEHMAPWNASSSLESSLTALEIYCLAISTPFETILELAEETGNQGETGWVPSWGKLMNVETCPYPYLPWLAMFTGTILPTKVSEAEARNQLHYGCNLNRGTLSHLNYGLKEVLGAGEFFEVQERTATNGTEAAYHFNVLVKKGKATNALYEKINEDVPAGLMYSVIEVENAWISGEKTWEEVPGTIVWNGTGATEPKEGINY